MENVLTNVILWNSILRMFMHLPGEEDMFYQTPVLGWHDIISFDRCVYICIFPTTFICVDSCHFLKIFSQLGLVKYNWYLLLVWCSFFLSFWHYRIWSSLSTQIGHPIPYPLGWSMHFILWILGRKWCYKEVHLYAFNSLVPGGFE